MRNINIKTLHYITLKTYNIKDYLYGNLYLETIQYYKEHSCFHAVLLFYLSILSNLFYKKKTIINPNRLMIKKNTSITCTQKFKIFTDFNLIFFYAATNMTSAKNQKKKTTYF